MLLEALTPSDQEKCIEFPRHGKGTGGARTLLPGAPVYMGQERQGRWAGVGGTPKDSSPHSHGDRSLLKELTFGKGPWACREREPAQEAGS